MTKKTKTATKTKTTLLNNIIEKKNENVLCRLDPHYLLVCPE
jgi:hypothetical protein